MVQTTSSYSYIIQICVTVEIHPVVKRMDKVKVKQSHYRPLGFQEVEASRFLDDRHMKVVRSALRTGRLYPPGNIPGTHVCRPQGNSAT
jgi:hypothetical protein